MTAANETDRTEVTTDAALGWLVRVQSDAASAEDWGALTLWLEASPAHRAAFNVVELLSFEIDESADEILAGLGPRSAEILPFKRRARAKTKPAWRRGAIAAASVGLAVMAGLGVWAASLGPVQSYRTAAGQTRAITLADGTHIQLDAASTLSVRLGWFGRRAVLGDAEATFDVAKDAHRPFQVIMGDQRVRVVGTEFNIRNYDDTTEVTVRRGVVAVYQADLGGQPVAVLTHGMALTHERGSMQSTVQRVDADQAFGWTQGRLICSDQSLSQIVTYLNRRYTTPIRLAPGLGERRFTGVLELGPEEDVARRLAAYLSLTMHGSDREISLS